MRFGLASLGIKQKLVLLGLVIVLVASFGFTLLHLRMARALAEDDLRDRAVAFAREIAATIGDRREFESGPLLSAQMRRIMDVRENVLQIDVLAFGPGGTTVVATSHPALRLPLTRHDVQRVLRQDAVSRLVTRGPARYWEVVAPVVLDGGVAGAVASRFSLHRADALAGRARAWSLGLTALSVAVMGLLMTLAVHVIVTRPIRRFLATIERIERGETSATVGLEGADELAVLGRHFDTMVVRLAGFSAELQSRVRDATRELEGRYREVERLNELLFATQRRLGHAERLALTGRLMAQVAHEVGTPLHSIAGHLELLRQDLASRDVGADAVRRLEIIDTELRRITEIITQLLDLTRRPPAVPEAVDLNRLTRETVEVVRPGLASAQVRLDVATGEDVPSVDAHRHQLQQVLINLLTNAIDATPPGGAITVATAHDAKSVRLEVSDTGRGIPEAEQRRIFEPFFSTKGAGRGSGLGLFIASEIVREHRGRITVVSEPGKGTTFRVELPVAEVG